MGNRIMVIERAYPVFIVKNQKDYLVYVPDMDIYTEGKSIENAIEMARDAIGSKGVEMEKDGQSLPSASNYADALDKVRKDSDNLFDYSLGIQTLVNVNFIEYKKKTDGRLVKKNCTIPNYLNVEAEKAGFNFSRILQEALANKLGYPVA